MAATDARPVPIKNQAFRYYFSIRKNDGTLITSWTGADSEVSLDGAAFSDCTNEATEVGTTGCGYLDLTAAEMNADAVTLKVTVTNTSALTLVVTFFPQEGADIKVDSTHLAGTAYASADLSETMKTSINTEADAALSDYGALKPTTAGRTLDVTATGAAGIDWGNVENPTTTLNLSGTTVKSVTDAVVATISGTLTTLDSLWTEVKKWLRVMIRSDASIAADYSAIVADINVNTGTGTGSYDNTAESLRALHAHAEDTQTKVESVLVDTTAMKGATFDASTDSLEAIRNRGDAAWTTGSGGGGGDATLANQETIIAHLVAMKGATFVEVTDSLEALRNRGDAAWTTATGFSTLTAGDVRTAVGLGSANLDTQLSSIAANVALVLADTGTDGVVLSAAMCNKIADHVRRRTQANVEASSDGDSLALSSLYGLIQQIQEAAAVGTTLTIYRTDGTTSLGTKTLATDPDADPVTGVS